MKRNRIALSLAMVGIAIFSSRASAQAEVAPWGNIEAIRVEGQRIPLHAALCVLGADGEVDEVARAELLAGELVADVDHAEGASKPHARDRARQGVGACGDV